MDELREKLEERLVINSITGCWEWYGSLDPAGYGMFRGQRVHRLMYENEVGIIPKELQIRHLCNNRRCVNPNHLEPGTAAENGADKINNPQPKVHKCWTDIVDDKLPLWQKRLKSQCTISDCWNWNGKRKGDTITPLIKIGNSSIRINRLYYYTFKQDLPLHGMFLENNCGNIDCVNPDHMVSSPHDKMLCLRTISPEATATIEYYRESLGLKKDEIVELLLTYVRENVKITELKAFLY